MFAQSVINISILRKAVNKNELFICVTTWMNLQGIILSQKKKKKKKNKTVSEDCILHDLFDLYKIFFSLFMHFYLFFFHFILFYLFFF